MCFLAFLRKALRPTPPLGFGLGGRAGWGESRFAVVPRQRMPCTVCHALRRRIGEGVQVMEHQTDAQIICYESVPPQLAIDAICEAPFGLDE